MKDLIIELTKTGAVWLQTRPSGDVEVVSTTQRNPTGGTDGDGCSVDPHDTCISTIPKSKRAEIADWLVSA